MVCAPLGKTGNGIIPTFPVYFLDTLTRIVSHLIGVTVIASNPKKTKNQSKEKKTKKEKNKKTKFDIKVKLCYACFTMNQF